MTIKQKLQLLMLATLLTIGGGIVATIVGFNAVHRAYNESVRRATEIRGLTEINANVMFAVRLDPGSEYTQRRFADADANIHKWIDTLMPLLPADESKEKLTRFQLQWNSYSKRLLQTFALAQHDAQGANTQAITLFHSDFGAMRDGIDLMTDEVGRAEKAGVVQTEHIIVTAKTTATIVLLAVLAVVVGWLLILSRQIVSSLSGIQRALQSASDALDLDQRAPVHGKDEIAQTASAFNALMERVAGVVLVVRDGAESVNTVSSEIATGNVDLSSRTEEQAAALEETAASMEELTGTVRRNADNARQAATLASVASDTANRGNAAVSQAVGTMQQISASAATIADITGIIEGIAFQTNILALNAAVEAARAGEQGRGFAVVAGEVRSLAQRASTAAKEIKELIETSVTTSARGSELVAHAGEAMAEVVKAAARVTAIMGDIAMASAEQSKGIDEVVRAITQMDVTTQQNAAFVEQSAAAAHSMQDQASKLKSAVNVFKLSGKRGLVRSLNRAH